MRIEIWDNVGQIRGITSRDPRLIGDWFAEHAAELMTADARMQTIRMNIWPQDHDEMRLIGQVDQLRLSQDGLLHLAEKILDASKKIADQEVVNA